MNQATMESYFNTTGLTGNALQSAKGRAISQDADVLAIFQQAGDALTPCEAHQRLAALGYGYLLTSVRRSITTLTKAQRLEKTAIRRPGVFGAMNFTWQLKKTNEVSK